MDSSSTVRLDKWLWAVRVFKTRSNATRACSAGHVKIQGHNVKPAHTVRAGEIVTARIGELTRTVRVLAPLEQRVSAKVVPEYAEDLTPASEYQKPRERKFAPVFSRPKGTGRPTKKERRALDQLDWSRV